MGNYNCMKMINNCIIYVRHNILYLLKDYQRIQNRVQSRDKDDLENEKRSNMALIKRPVDS